MRPGGRLESVPAFAGKLPDHGARIAALLTVADRASNGEDLFLEPIPGVAMEASDVTLMRGDLLSVADAIHLSRATLRKIKQNLFWAFFYNVMGIPLAALGFLSPVVAGAAMAFSSVSVVSNTLLLRRWRPDR